MFPSGHPGYVVLRGPLAEARRVIDEGWDVNEKDDSGSTVILPACRNAAHDCTERVELLLRSRADVNVGDRDFPLLTQCVIQCPNIPSPTDDPDDGVMAGPFAKAIVELVLEAEADVGLRDVDGATALHHAAKLDVDVAEMLIARGADLNARDGGGRTPIFEANDNGFDLLVRKGAALNVCDDVGLTPLHYSTRARAAEQLLAAGAKLEARIHRPSQGEEWPYDDVTPLLEAVRFDRLEVAQVLLQHGADLDAQTQEGKTALDLACEPQMRELLEGELAKQRVLTVTGRRFQGDDAVVTYARMAGEEREVQLARASAVDSLRSVVARAEGVPAHQVKLLVGTTLLSDTSMPLASALAALESRLG